MNSRPAGQEHNDGQEFNDVVKDGATWLQTIERVRQGPRFLIEKPNPLSDAIAADDAASRHVRGPIWLGRELKKESNEELPWYGAAAICADIPP